MATSHLSQTIQAIRTAVLRHDGAGLNDRQLLDHFIRHRDEAAFAALMRRHGPVVWGVCRRLTGHHQDAEDAFQATFLVLARKAASVRQPEMLANWLFGVAHRTALKAKATTGKRRSRETQVSDDMPEPVTQQRGAWVDLEPLIDQELAALPDKYRIAIILCDLQGKTGKQAAHQLKVPEGTLSSRLRTARVMLAKRLARQGIAWSAGALAAVASQNPASALAPTAVVSSTTKAATLIAAGQTATGVVSAKVAALTKGALTTMVLSKLKSAAIWLLASLAVLAAGLLTYQATMAQQTNAGQAKGRSLQPPGGEAKQQDPPADDDRKKDANARLPGGELPKAEAVLDRYIEVTGGKTAYQTLKNRVSKGTVEISGLSGEITIYQAAPCKSYSEIDLQNVIKIEQGTDGVVVWEKQTATGISVLKGSAKSHALLQAQFHGEVDWRKLFKRVQCVAEEEVGDIPCHKVEMTPKEGKVITKYFDKKSGLLLKMSEVINGPDGDTDTHVILSDYKKVDGKELPHRMEVRYGDKRYAILTISKFTLNKK